MQLNNNEFKVFIKDIKQMIYSAKSKAILSANRLMIELYSEIGKSIVEKQESLGWGKSVVEQMSKDLIEEFGEKSGYSSQNLWYMRQFYLAYQDNLNLQQLVGEIPWGSNILIFSKCKNDDAKKYYITNTIENGWNRNVLMHHIKTNLFQRDKIEEKINNFDVALPSHLSELAIELKVGKFKPEYAGKMNFYLNLLNDKVKMPHENPSIDIILCTDKDGLEVEYALQNIVQPMGVSTYTVKEKLPDELANALPSKAELEKQLLQTEDLE